MAEWPYHLVDVFTDRPFGGNPLAVFPDGEQIPERHYQPIARELNLSETTFVLPPRKAGTDFRVRIFTPGQELPMAGHPTVGTAYVLAREGRIAAREGTARVVFEEGVGPIPVELRLRGGEAEFVTMDQPLPAFGPVFEDRGAVAEMLSLAPEELEPGLPCEVVSCGRPYLFVPLRSLDAVRRARLRLEVWEPLLRAFAARNVFVFSRETETPGAAAHSRHFAPAVGVAEDPATGAANGPLGCYLVAHGLEPAAPRAELVAEQGYEMGRPSTLHIAIEQAGGAITRVQVGGQCVAMGTGRLHLP